MATPVKAYIQPTTYSNRWMNTYNTNHYMTQKITTPISTMAKLTLSIPVMYNPCGLMYNLVWPETNVSLNSTFHKSTLATGALQPISTKAMIMLTNTFPAAYQTVSVRPSVGQLYPLTGSIPY